MVEEENHLPKRPFLDSMLIFQDVCTYKLMQPPLLGFPTKATGVHLEAPLDPRHGRTHHQKQETPTSHSGKPGKIFKNTQLRDMFEEEVSDGGWHDKNPSSCSCFLEGDMM